MNLEQRTVEILAQVVYKELAQDRRDKVEFTDGFWDAHQKETLELARNILRVNKQINPVK